MSEFMSILRTGREDEVNAWLVSGFHGPSIGPFSVAIWQEGPLIQLAGSAQAYPSFPFGCVQDTIIGALFCALDQEGSLSLDEPVEKYLPELVGMASGKVPQLSHLLSHSSGFWLVRPDASDESPQQWGEFLRLLEPRLTPGSISAHSLIDRIILLKVVERVTGRPAYTELQERFFASSETMATQPSGGPFAQCHRELHGSLNDLGMFLEKAARSSWFDRLATGTMRPITLAPNVRPWAPVADGLGLYRLANGILGQDGDHARLGYLGIRLSPSCDTAVIGHFRSSSIRDHIMNRAVSDLMGIALPPRNVMLGDLNGFEPEDLSGAYSGIWGSRLYIESVEQQVNIATSREMRPMTAQIEPDGTLTGRWAAPNLWVEPQYLRSDNLPAFRFGKNLYLKD